MNHIGTNQMNGHDVARVHSQLGRRIGKLPRFDPKIPLLRRNWPHRQRCKGHDQSGHYKKEEKETRTHTIKECWMARTWNRSRLYRFALPVDFCHHVTYA